MALQVARSSHVVWVICLLLSSLATPSAAHQHRPSPKQAVDAALHPLHASPGACAGKHSALFHRYDRSRCALPVDEASPPADWAPWTHQPYCVNASNSRHRYCVYTDDGYGSHGISFITRPEVAANSVSLLEDGVGSVTEVPEGLEDGEEEDSSSGSRGGKTEGELEAPFKIVDIPGKGKGAVATRLIRRFETLLHDHASVLADVAFPSSVKKQQGYGLLHRAAEQLAHPGRLLDLGRSSTANADIVEDVIRTNSFEFDLLGIKHMAVFPFVSRINHACNPNSFIHFSPTTPDVKVAAHRDIQPGEELSISYIPYGLPFDKRQATLKRWGFTCTCDACLAPADVRARSDALRNKYETLKTKVIEAIQEGKLYLAIKLSKQCLVVLEEEEMEPLMSEQYETIARLYWAVQDRRNSEKYARLALKNVWESGLADTGMTEEEDVAKLFASFAE